MKSLFIAALCGALLIPALLSGAEKPWKRTTHDVNVVFKSAVEVESSDGVYRIAQKKKSPGCHIYFRVKPGSVHTATVTFVAKEDGKGWLLLRDIKRATAAYQAVTLNDKPLLAKPMVFDGANIEDREYLKDFTLAFKYKAGDKLVFKFDLLTPHAAKAAEAAPAPAAEPAAEPAE